MFFCFMLIEFLGFTWVVVLIFLLMGFCALGLNEGWWRAFNVLLGGLETCDNFLYFLTIGLFPQNSELFQKIIIGNGDPPERTIPNYKGGIFYRLGIISMNKIYIFSIRSRLITRNGKDRAHR